MQLCPVYKSLLHLRKIYKSLFIHYLSKKFKESKEFQVKRILKIEKLIY